MGTNERVKRPRLDRTQPIRSWVNLFDLSGASGQPATEGGRGASLGDVISRSVDLGYRVVDDYIRQGQKAAERLSGRSYGPDTLGSDAQELGARMMKYTSDFLGLWLQLMELAMGGGAWRAGVPPTPARATPSQETPAARAAPSTDGRTEAPDETPVRIKVVSLWPTEVALDLRPGAARAPLVIQALRAVEPDVPRLDDVSFTAGSEGDPPLLCIRVPPSQPPGTYNGLLIDPQTSRPVGTVSVRVSRE